MARHHHNAPAPLITGDVVRITVYITVSAQTTEVNLDYMTPTIGYATPLNVAQMLATFVLQQVPFLRAILSQDATITLLTGRVLNNNTVPTQQSPQTLAGNVVADALPTTVAGIVKKLSALRGQHGQGRNYFPAIPLTFTTPAVDPNTLNAAGLTAYQGYATVLQAGLTIGAVNIPLVITTRPVAPAFLTTNAAIVTSCAAVNLLGNQRRRREGRGI